MRRTCVLTLLFVFGLVAPAVAAGSSAHLWTALSGTVACGVAIRESHTPAQVLCSARNVPAPKDQGPAYGDPGNVFLGSNGRPVLARLSQDTFAGADDPVALGKGTTWHTRAIGVRCTVSTSAVRCVNRSRHGFTITRHSYTSF